MPHSRQLSIVWIALGDTFRCTRPTRVGLMGGDLATDVMVVGSCSLEDYCAIASTDVAYLCVHRTPRQVCNQSRSAEPRSGELSLLLS